MAHKEVEFPRAPVVETVLGVQFEPLKRLTNGHLGAFWKMLGSDWPNASDALPIATVHERFGAESTWRELGAQLTLTQHPGSRIRIRNENNTRMVQAQNGRLHLNWLRQGESEYPRYEKIRPEFDSLWRKFQEFIRDEALGDLQPNQWEVTYVNEIPKGTVWHTHADWVGLFPSLVQMSGHIRTARLEGFEGQWHYEIEPQRGRLHVQAHHGRKAPDDKMQVIILQLTARGPISDGDGGCSLGEGLDCGHESIVQTFVELTSEAARDYWKG